MQIVRLCPYSAFLLYFHFLLLLILPCIIHFLILRSVLYIINWHHLIHYCKTILIITIDFLIILFFNLKPFEFNSAYFPVMKHCVIKRWFIFHINFVFISFLKPYFTIDTDILHSYFRLSGFFLLTGYYNHQ